MYGGGFRVEPYRPPISNVLGAPTGAYVEVSYVPLQRVLFLQPYPEETAGKHWS